MRATSDRLSALIGHGLSEYEARVYLALLEFPSANAGTLAKASRVPRNRLYEVLENLHQAGLVDVLLDRTTREYRARPLGAYLDHQLAELRTRMKELESRRAEANLVFRPPEPGETADLDVGQTRAVLGRRAVAREVDRLLEAATTQLAAVASAGGVERLVRYLSLHAAGLDRRLAPDASLEVFLPHTAAGHRGLERLGERLAAAVRWTDVALNTMALVVDDREILLVHAVPDDDLTNAGRDFAILSTNRALLRDHLALVRRAVF